MEGRAPPPKALATAAEIPGIGLTGAPSRGRMPSVPQLIAAILLDI